MFGKNFLEMTLFAEAAQPCAKNQIRKQAEGDCHEHAFQDSFFRLAHRGFRHPHGRRNRNQLTQLFEENTVMFFRQIAVATALYAMLLLASYAMLDLTGATAFVPTLDVGIRDSHKESSSAYSFDPDVIVLMEEDIIP